MQLGYSEEVSSHVGCCFTLCVNLAEYILSECLIIIAYFVHVCFDSIFFTKTKGLRKCMMTDGFPDARSNLPSTDL